MLCLCKMETRCPQVRMEEGRPVVVSDRLPVVRSRPVVISNRLVVIRGRLVVIRGRLVMAVVVSDRLVVVRGMPVVVRDRNRPIEIGINKQNLVKVRRCNDK